MNTPSFNPVRLFNKNKKKWKIQLATGLWMVLVLSVGGVARAEWTIDLSRRQRSVRDSDLNSDSGLGSGLGSPYDNGAQASGRAPASENSNYERQITGEDDVTQIQPQDRGSGGARTSSHSTEKTKSFISQVFDPGEATQDLVILNTEKGFVPSTVRVRKGSRYLIHVVNVNEKEKNVSFILDAFSEHHATFFGKERTFVLEPKKEGVYSFQSPETSAEGRLVVFTQTLTVREPSSDAAKGENLDGGKDENRADADTPAKRKLK